MTITFLLDSDLHFKYGIIEYKSDHVNKIIEQVSKEKIDALICAGDLTNNGWDGSHILCWKYGGEYDQLSPLKEQFVEPLEKHLPVYLCHGNHDKYVPRPYIHHGVLNYIKKRHGGLMYSFDINDIHFVCLGMYPDKKALEYLKKDMEKNLDKNVVIFFHFNLVGQYSDWWSDEEKENFYNVIKNYKIVALLVGHIHISKIYNWKGYPVIVSSHRSIAKCSITNGQITVNFI